MYIRGLHYRIGFKVHETPAPTAAARSKSMGEDRVSSEFDELVETLPDAIFDARSYYWPNFVQPVCIYHSFKKFVFSIELPTPIHESKAYYVASFGESLLLTWVGIEATINSRIGASTSMTVRVVRGNNPYTDDRTQGRSWVLQSANTS